MGVMSMNKWMKVKKCSANSFTSVACWTRPTTVKVELLQATTPTYVTYTRRHELYCNAIRRKSH